MTENQATTAQLKVYQEFRQEALPMAGSQHHVKSNKKEGSRILHFIIKNQQKFFH